MNKLVVQQIAILSLILGLILGCLGHIPFIGIFMLFALLLLSAPVVIVYLIMDGKLDLTSPKDSIISGALIGFCANLSFSIIYSIIIVILFKLFHYTSNFFLTTMVVNSPIWILITFIIFLGVLCGTTNSFSGFATYYIINLIRDIYEAKHPEIKQQDTQEDYK